MKETVSLLEQARSHVEDMFVEEGRWYRRGPPCHVCEDSTRLGVIFEGVSDQDVTRERCATCTVEIDIREYGARQTGKFKILYAPESEVIADNPYLNPLVYRSDVNLEQLITDAGLHDIGNGRRFAALHRGRVVYTHAAGWLIYDGRRWLRDEIGGADRLAKTMLEELIRIANLGDAFDDRKERTAFLAHVLATSSAGRVKSMLQMAQSEAHLVARIEEFDQHPWILNTLNGFVNLATGTLHPHDPDMLVTQITRLEYDAAATCPRWDQFILEVTCGNQELAQWLQLAVGYTLTGDTSEQCLFFLHGDGANGKSTFLEILRELVGDYGLQLTFETFLRSKRGTPETALSPMPGKRFATACEAGEARRFDEEVIRMVTGGDTVRTRRLYENSFEFKPVVKIWLAANDKPTVGGVNEGIWRRFRLLPFNADFRANKDPHLGRKLQGELQGILAWAVRGAIAWHQKKLDPLPAIMQEALDEYRAENDALGRFISDSCSLGDGYEVRAQDLLRAYNAWAEENNEQRLTQTMLGVRLRKFKGARLAKGRVPGAGHVVWQGLMLQKSFELEERGLHRFNS